MINVLQNTGDHIKLKGVRGHTSTVSNCLGKTFGTWLQGFVGLSQQQPTVTSWHTVKAQVHALYLTGHTLGKLSIM